MHNHYKKANSGYCFTLYFDITLFSILQCRFLKYNLIHYYNTAGYMLVSQLAVWGTMDSRQPPNSDGQTPVQSFVHSLVRKTPRNCIRRKIHQFNEEEMCLPTWWLDMSSPYQLLEYQTCRSGGGRVYKQMSAPLPPTPLYNCGNRNGHHCNEI